MSFSFRNDVEAGVPVWDSSEERAKMLRALNWMEMGLEHLGNKALERVYNWYEAKMAAEGRCHQEVSGTVRKERRQNDRCQGCWRWVVYTRLGDDASSREHGEFKTRHEALKALWRYKSLRLVDELDPRYGRLARGS